MGMGMGMGMISSLSVTWSEPRDRNSRRPIRLTIDLSNSLVRSARTLPGSLTSTNSLIS